MRTIQVGLLGCGTVGTGVARILIENRDLIFSRVGAILNLKRVADIDQKTDRGIRGTKVSLSATRLKWSMILKSILLSK